jgi:hypothetical protein
MAIGAGLAPRSDQDVELTSPSTWFPTVDTGDKFNKNVEQFVSGTNTDIPLWMQGKGTLGDTKRVEELSKIGEMTRQQAQEALMQLKGEAAISGESGVFDNTNPQVANQNVPTEVSRENLPEAVSQQERQAH